MATFHGNQMTATQANAVGVLCIKNIVVYILSKIMTSFVNFMDLVSLLNNYDCSTKPRGEIGQDLHNPFQEAVNDRAVHTHDQDFFVVDGIECSVQSIYRFNWCGYVKLPQDHPDFMLNQRQMNAVYQVHNGITYCQDGIIGFTTVNDNDYCLMREMKTGVSEARLKYRSYSFVKLQTIKLAKQICERYIKLTPQRRSAEPFFPIFMDPAGKWSSHRQESKKDFCFGNTCSTPHYRQPSAVVNFMDISFAKEQPKCTPPTNTCFNNLSDTMKPQSEPKISCPRPSNPKSCENVCANFCGQKSACQAPPFVFGFSPSCNVKQNFSFGIAEKTSNNASTLQTNKTDNNLWDEQIKKALEPIEIAHTNMTNPESFTDKSQPNTEMQPAKSNSNSNSNDADMLLKLVDKIIENFGKQFMENKNESSDKSNDFFSDSMEQPLPPKMTPHPSPLMSPCHSPEEDEYYHDASMTVSHSLNSNHEMNKVSESSVCPNVRIDSDDEVDKCD